jgi:hypothetical protein
MKIIFDELAILVLLIWAQSGFAQLGAGYSYFIVTKDYNHQTILRIYVTYFILIAVFLIS